MAEDEVCVCKTADHLPSDYLDECDHAESNYYSMYVCFLTGNVPY